MIGAACCGLLAMVGALAGVWLGTYLVWVVVELAGVGLLAAAAQTESLTGRTPVRAVMWSAVAFASVTAGGVVAAGVWDRAVGAMVGGIAMGVLWWFLARVCAGHTRGLGTVAMGALVGELAGLADIGLAAALVVCSVLVWSLRLLGRRRTSDLMGSGRALMLVAVVALMVVSIWSGQDPSRLLRDATGANP